MTSVPATVQVVSYGQSVSVEGDLCLHRGLGNNRTMTRLQAKAFADRLRAFATAVEVAAHAVHRGERLDQEVKV